MAIIGKSCGGCKHFGRKAPPLDSECRRYPPETKVIFIGVHPQKGPQLHREAGYGVVHDALEACGEYVQRLAIELN